MFQWMLYGKDCLLVRKFTNLIKSYYCLVTAFKVFVTVNNAKSAATFLGFNQLIYKIVITVSFFLIIIIAGCASQSNLNIPTNHKKQTTDANIAKVAPEVKERSFNSDTLYDLLLAELSIHNYQYDVTFAYYKKQAFKTRDVGVIQRAWRIANFIGARKSAIDIAKLWVEVEPKSLLALNALSLELMLSGRLVESGKLMLDVTKRGGQGSFELLARYAEESTAEERGKLLTLFKKSEKLLKNNAQLYFSKSILLYQNRQFKDALRACNKTLKLKIPGSQAHARIILMKAKILSEQEKIQEAKIVLANGLNMYPSATRVRVQYVKTLLDLGEVKEARFNMELLFLRALNDPEILLMLSILALEGDFLDDASRYLNKLQVHSTYYNVANYHLGRIYALKDEWEQARDHFMQVGSGRYFLSSRVLLAQTLLEQGQLAKLQNDFSASRKAYPNYGSQLFLLETEALMEKKEYKLASDVLNQAMQNYKQDISLLYTRAMLSDKMNNFHQTEKDLRKILSLDSDNVAALNALGFSLAHRNERLEEARKLIIKALKLRPSDPAIMDSLGWVEYQLKNYEVALGYLYRAYHATKDAEIAAHLGEVLWVSGKQADAWNIWSEALEFEPDHSALRETLDRFQIKQVSGDITNEEKKKEKE